MPYTAPTKTHRWWKPAKTTPVHQAVFDTARWLEKNQAYQAEANLRHVRMYANLPMFGLTPSTFAIADARRPKRLRYNLYFRRSQRDLDKYSCTVSVLMSPVPRLLRLLDPAW